MRTFILGMAAIAIAASGENKASELRQIKQVKSRMLTTKEKARRASENVRQTQEANMKMLNDMQDRFRKNGKNTVGKIDKALAILAKF